MDQELKVGSVPLVTSHVMSVTVKDRCRNLRVGVARSAHYTVSLPRERSYEMRWREGKILRKTHERWFDDAEVE